MRALLLGVVLLALAGAALVASTWGGASTAAVVGGNLPVNTGALDPNDLSAHNSPSVVRNPTDGANIVVANRIDEPNYSCALHVSLDGGVRWTQTALPVPEGEEPKCYAPDLAFGADGTLYVSFVTLQGLGNVPNAVWLVQSGDKGRSVSDPSKLHGPLAFQVRLSADPVVPGRLYRSWVQAESVGLYAFPESGNPIQFARSDDGGATWKGSVRINGPARQRVVAPTLDIGPRGELYALYLDLVDDKLDYAGGHQGRGGPPYEGSWQLILSRSLDGGATWKETVVEEKLAPVERMIVFIPPFPSLAVDRRSGRIFAGFHDAGLGDADVLVWVSKDGGASFGQAKRVNDTRPSDGTSQYLPKLDVAPNGRLDVVYYDRRADQDDVMNQVSVQSSFDAAKTFTPSLHVADRSFDSRIGFGAERDFADLGSRLGLLSAPTKALAVWTDTRAGTQDSGKQDVVRAVVEIAPPEDLPQWVTYGLRLVALALGGLGLWLVVPRVLRRFHRAGGSSPALGPVAPG